MNNLNELFDRNFIEYASYVIKDRAIPDAADGLKPVQRRIFHAMYEKDDGRFNKVANVAGNTMQYHPHGDASIVDALVVLANKEYFIDKQGNFGNILTGDRASAARYIECRLNGLAKEVLFNPSVTEYMDNYDGRHKEPITLPAKLPVLLLLGAEGIAVGMSTKILPHNFGEILAAEIALLKGENIALYPDFQQGGIMDVSDYRDGLGKVRIRARIEKKDDKTVLIKEIPYGTTTESIINSIEAASRKNQIKISSINDFTTEKVEIEVKSARGENADNLLKGLYAFTDCELVINTSMIAIVNNKPKLMTVTELLKYNSQRLLEILDKELHHKEATLSEQLQQLTLEQIFIENRIYKEIEELEEYPLILQTVEKSMNRFKNLFIRELTNDDIERLLEIKIKRISRYDMNKNRKTIDDIVKALEKVRYNIAHLKPYAIGYLKEIDKKYSPDFPRKTEISAIKVVDTSEIKLPESKVYFNLETGFAGTDVKSENPPLLLKPKDKIIVFNKRGTFKVIPIEGKTFIDTDVLYINVFDAERTYTLIYTDLDKNITFIKRFKINSFMQNKEYSFVKAENAKINYFSVLPEERLKFYFVKKPKQKINEEVVDTKILDVKSYSSLGVRVGAGKEVEKIVRLEKKEISKSQNNS